MQKFIAVLLVTASFSMPSLASQPDKNANSLVLSSKGMLDWLAQGYEVAGATMDMIILKGGRGGIALCRVGQQLPGLRMSGLGTNTQKPDAKPEPREDSLDVSRCYTPRGQ